MRNLKARTKKFALDVIRFCDTLPGVQSCWIISKQLMRSASSAGANYRASCRAKSRADFIAKLSIIEEEADESAFWLELLEEPGIGNSKAIQHLKDEASQLVAIVVASKKKAHRNSSFGRHHANHFADGRVAQPDDLAGRVFEGQHAFLPGLLTDRPLVDHVLGLYDHVANLA